MNETPKGRRPRFGKCMLTRGIYKAEYFMCGGKAGQSAGLGRWEYYLRVECSPA